MWALSITREALCSTIEGWSLAGRFAVSLFHCQRSTLPSKTLRPTTTRHKFIDELPDEINDKTQNFMCGKDLLKMKRVSNKTGKVVSCNNLVQFKIVMERLDGIIKGLKVKRNDEQAKVHPEELRGGGRG